MEVRSGSSDHGFEALGFEACAMAVTQPSQILRSGLLGIVRTFLKLCQNAIRDPELGIINPFRYDKPPTPRAAAPNENTGYEKEYFFCPKQP